MAYERESRTLVVDGRLVNVNGAGEWDHRIDPLNGARTPEIILFSELGERGAAFSCRHAALRHMYADEHAEEGRAAF